RGRGFARDRVDGRHDGRLGAAAERSAGEGEHAHHQRGARRQPRGGRHLLQTAVDNRVGVTSLRSLVALLLGGAACAAAAPRTVSLRIKGDVPDASVTIDDQYIGALGYVSAHGVALPSGKHRITVEKAGYFPWDRLVEATDSPIRLDVALVRIPD